METKKHKKQHKKHNKKKTSKPRHKNKQSRKQSPKKQDKYDYKPVNCSPNPNKSEFSCYTNEALFKMKSYWNARHQRDTISTNDPKKIWLELRRK